MPDDLPNKPVEKVIAISRGHSPSQLRNRRAGQEWAVQTEHGFPSGSAVWAFLHFCRCEPFGRHRFGHLVP